MFLGMMWVLQCGFISSSETHQRQQSHALFVTCIVLCSFYYAQCVTFNTISQFTCCTAQATCYATCIMHCVSQLCISIAHSGSPSTRPYLPFWSRLRLGRLIGFWRRLLPPIHQLCRYCCCLLDFINRSESATHWCIILCVMTHNKASFPWLLT